MELNLQSLLDVQQRRFEYRGNNNGLRQPISGISIDSRTIEPGQLYFALCGDNHDGHDFVLQALAKGACAVIVNRKWWQAQSDLEGSIFIVDDTLSALQTLAKQYRRRFRLPVLALTGTNGKTTTKEMIAAVLSNLGPICKNEGNLNNHIGLPLTLCRLATEHKAAVIEMGMNHHGEIAQLCEIAEPDFGLITNIGHGHTEFLKDVDGVAQAKMELFEYLQPHGRIFVNLDDKLIRKYSHEMPNRITFGFDTEAKVRGTRPGLNQFGQPEFEVDGMRLRLPLYGKHNLSNALAAVAVGLHFSISLADIKARLEDITVPGNRMQRLEHRGITWLNDSYNANPESTIAALETLAAIQGSKRKVFIFGDMLELGAASSELHKRVGEAAVRLDIDIMLTFGDNTRSAHLQAGFDIAEHFDDKSQLSERARELLQPGDAVLLKGSRGMKMEEIVDTLTTD